MKKNNVKVSIIVPVYNGEKYLPKCLDSLVNQTLSDIEIVIINDGSKDNSHDVIDKYASVYSNKIVYKKIKNGGVSNARNMALDMANGEYILFCDCDDYIDLDMCETLYNKAKETHSEYIVCGYYSEDEKGKFKKMSLGNMSEYSKSLEENPNIIFDSNSFIASKLISKKIIDKYNIRFNKKYNIFEDLLFAYMTMLKANKIEKVNKAFYHYIRRDGVSASGGFGSKFYDLFPVMDDLKEYYLENTNVDFQEQLTFLAIRHSFMRFVTFHKLKDTFLKIKYINNTFDYLDEFDGGWKKNKYFKLKKINYKIFRSKIVWFFSPIMFGMIEFLKKVKNR